MSTLALLALLVILAPVVMLGLFTLLIEDLIGRRTGE